MTLKSILLVDDSEADQLLASIAVEQYDNDILLYKAYDGAEALHLLTVEKLKPSVILLDINMPGMDGHEFLKQYSTHRLDQPVVVMLTSSIQDIDKQKCEQYSFIKDYISKPLLAKYLDNIKSLLTLP